MNSQKNINKVSKEAHAYTPGLKVKRSIKVRKTRKLPILGEVYVKEGNEVNYNTVVAKTQISGDPEIVRAAMLLGIDSEDLPMYMDKKEGDRVSNGEVIASYSTMFGLFKKQVYSPIDGIVETVSDASGQVIIRGLPVPVEIDAYIPGKIVEVLSGEGVIIETNAALIQGIIGVGGEAHGEIKMAVKSPREVLTAELISPEDKGTILVGGSIVTLEALRRGIEVEVSCIVAGGVRYNDLTTLIGEPIGVAITGHEEVGLTLIVTEGFGKINMSERTFKLLKHFEGYIASVNGATQVRAGVLRPEIIIPNEEHSGEISGDKLTVGMIPGTLVRIIRTPHFGAIGKVVSLPIELQQITTKSQVRVLEVELEDGNVVTVPRANVEIIEE